MITFQLGNSKHANLIIWCGAINKVAASAIVTPGTIHKTATKCRLYVASIRRMCRWYCATSAGYTTPLLLSFAVCAYESRKAGYWLIQFTECMGVCILKNYYDKPRDNKSQLESWAQMDNTHVVWYYVVNNKSPDINPTRSWTFLKVATLYNSNCQCLAKGHRGQGD
jgi:hypothetical protein